MKKICVLGLLIIATKPAISGVDVVYGNDDRKDIYETSNATHLKLAKSTAGMIHKAMFTKGRPNGSFDLKNTQTLETAENLCTSEKFSDQPLAPTCSGFLVGPDTLITAGHCYKSFHTPQKVCNDFAWVFDYEMKSASSDPTKNISIENIYNCKSVTFAQLDDQYDFSIIKLDRKVVGREPLKYRSSGKIANSDQLVVIGHPSGLPTKISAGGKVNYNNEPTRFSTNLDTFHGNSGSAVFNAVTGQVEGILIMGKNDYLPSISQNPNSCKIVNKCTDAGQNCSAGVESGPIQYGEVVLRIEKIASLISKALAIK